MNRIILSLILKLLFLVSNAHKDNIMTDEQINHLTQLLKEKLSELSQVTDQFQKESQTEDNVRSETADLSKALQDLKEKIDKL